MLLNKISAFLLMAAIVIVFVAGTAFGHGTSYVSVHNKGGGYKYDYKIHHGKHGHWSGHAHPHGYGGFGEKHHYRR